MEGRADGVSLRKMFVIPFYLQSVLVHWVKLAQYHAEEYSVALFCSW
jgi:hypothetical protein